MAQSKCGRSNEVSEYGIRDFADRKTNVAGGIKKINFLKLRALECPLVSSHAKAAGYILQGSECNPPHRRNSRLAALFPFLLSTAQKESRLPSTASWRYCRILRSSIFFTRKRANGGQRTQNRLEKYYLRAITPRLSFLILPDGFLMNLAGHIGFFINSMPRIFNLMITVSP